MGVDPSGVFRVGRDPRLLEEDLDLEVPESTEVGLPTCQLEGGEERLKRSE